jgi:opacity protein-like surface antigen
MKILTSAALAMLVAAPAYAASDQWTHTAAVYMIGAGIDGTAGIGPVTGDVDVSFSDILENLEFGAMAAYRGEKGPFAVIADLIYMDLETDKDGLGPFGNTRATVELDQLITELDASYAVTDRLDAYVGLRYWDVDSTIEVIGGGPLGETLNASTGEDWVDLLYGLRYALPLGSKWTLVWRADMAPFGTGSEFSWHTSAYADWRLGDHAHALIGFRWLDVDYDDGEGADRFVMDVSEGGPTIGFAWTF